MARENCTAAQAANAISARHVAVLVLRGTFLQRNFRRIVDTGRLTRLLHLDVSHASLCVSDITWLMKGLQGAQQLQRLFTHGNLTGCKGLKAIVHGLGDLAASTTAPSLHTVSISGSVSAFQSLVISTRLIESLEKLPKLHKILISDSNGAEFNAGVSFVLVDIIREKFPKVC